MPPELSAEADAYVGHDGVRRYFASFRDAVEGIAFEVEDVGELGEGRLVGRARISGRGRESGISVEMSVPLAIRVRDGKLARMRAYPDWEEAVAAVRGGD